MTILGCLELVWTQTLTIIGAWLRHISTVLKDGNDTIGKQAGH